MNKVNDYIPNIVAEFNRDMTKAVVIEHNDKAGMYYEIGIELPMDLGSVENLDADKIRELVDIKGIAISVEAKTSDKYFSLENKPALFVMASEASFDEILDWAEECVEKMADFDFADYYITHNGYDDLTKDEQPDWIKDQSYNIDSGEWEEAR